MCFVKNNGLLTLRHSAPVYRRCRLRAIAIEDYDEAKRIKEEIEVLQQPPPPPPLSTEEEQAAKHKLMIETVKKGIVDVRDRNHDGDTHKFFDHLDHTGARRCHTPRM
eukprot:SAG31_NODE_4304_length_3370_cov_1.370835_4_plen_108_part_00